MNFSTKKLIVSFTLISEEPKHHQIDSVEAKNREDNGVVGNVVFVTGLAWTTNEEELTKHFSSVGKVVEASIVRKERRGKMISLGRGSVKFSTDAEASKAITMLNGTQLDGREITCREFFER